VNFFVGRLLSLIAFFAIAFQPCVSCASVENSPLDCRRQQSAAQPQKNVGGELLSRLRSTPLNAIGTALFFAAIAHTFMAASIAKMANGIAEQSELGGRRMRSLPIKLLRVLGEIELPFALWAVPAMAAIAIIGGPKSLGNYLRSDISLAEPIFIFAIMAMAATRPILMVAETILGAVAKLGGGSPTAWWFSIVLIAPPLGSLITEPAAMAIAAILLSRKIYAAQVSEKLRYGTLGLLFTNISVGGALTHFAAPPIVMVAHRWNWSLSYVFMNFGVRAIGGILLATAMCGFFLRKDLASLSRCECKGTEAGGCSVLLILCHVALMAWTVCNLHCPVKVTGGFCAFLAVVRLSRRQQSKLRLKEAALVGLFLAGLVVHGGLQTWWIGPLLDGLCPIALFAVAMAISSCNDNAAVTYLTSMVPSFQNCCALQNAVVSGAICGGGLTVIANAPNPAGHAMLKRHFPGGVSSLRLLLAAAIPTSAMVLCFLA
jgi:hypothetical protein